MKTLSELITADGLVISRREYGDASCFIDVLTKEYGVVEIAVSGAKKLNSKNASATSLFSYSRFCLNKKSKGYSINSVQPKLNFHGLSKDIRALALAAYFAEVIKYVSVSEQRGGDLLRLTLIALYELNKNPELTDVFKSVFEFRLTRELGISPDLVACSNCATYLSENMRFPVNDGIIICADCFDEHFYSLEAGECFFLSAEVLQTMRRVLYSPLEKIFKSNIPHEFSVIAEEYLLYHLGRKFKTLDYFKKI